MPDDMSRSKRPYRRLSAQERAEIVAMRQSGKKLREIAAELGRPIGTVGTVLWTLPEAEAPRDA